METPYAGIYRAKALGWRPGVLTALVPQVFGDITIEITQFTGEAPQGTEMGWVYFESGDPEHPVWSSKVAGGDLDSLGDVDTSTTPPADGQGLMWDAALGQWVPGGPVSGPMGPMGLSLPGRRGDRGLRGLPGTPGAPGPGIQVVTALPGTLDPLVLYVVV